MTKELLPEERIRMTNRIGELQRQRTGHLHTAGLLQHEIDRMYKILYPPTIKKINNQTN